MLSVSSKSDMEMKNAIGNYGDVNRIFPFISHRIEFADF